MDSMRKKATWIGKETTECLYDGISGYGAKDTYDGCIKEQMQQIRHDGLIAAPVAYIMLRRLECIAFPQADTQEREILCNDLCTGDAFVAYPTFYFKCNRFRYLYDFFNKYDIDKMCETNTIYGEGIYKFRDNNFEPSDGILFDPNKNESYLHHCTLTLKKVLDSRLWKVAARHPQVVEQTRAWDSRLLGEYARRCVFPLSKQAMPLYLGAFPQWDIELGIVRLDQLDTWSEGNSALHRWEEIERYFVTSLVTHGRGKIIGITPETLEAARLRSTKVCEKLSQC